MDVEIVKKSGKVFRLSDYGVVQDFVVNSIDKRTHREDIEGRPGAVNYGSYDGDRTITVPFIFKAYDLHDYVHLRDKLYGLLDDGEPFYIREMRRLNYLQYEFVDFGEGHKWSPGTDDRYVNGKQMLVRMNSAISPEQQFKNGNVDLEFISDELPYFESAYTTLDLHDTGYSATAEKYGLVDNINDEKVKYRFTQDMQSNFIPKSDTSVAGNKSSWRPRGTNVVMNSSVQNESWFLIQTTNSGTYIATESDELAFDLIAGEEYTLTYFAHPSSIVNSLDHNWLMRSGQPNLKLPSPEVTEDYGIRTGTTYYNKYDITFTAEFTGKCRVMIGGNIPTDSAAFIYFSYPRLYKGTESKSWSEVIPDGGTTSFTVYNAGNVTIEPESMYLNIGMRNVTTSGGFTIRNETTGEEHIINSVHERRHLRLNGIVATSGTNNNFRNTNRRFISLAPGDNELTVSGGTFEEIEIDFKYLYK